MKTASAQLITPSSWTVTGVDASSKASLSVVSIKEKLTRSELARYFTELTACNGAIAVHATCMADHSIVLYFGTDEKAVREHRSFHLSMQAAHGGFNPPRIRRTDTRGFGFA
jgi:hypothetical protein